MNRLNLSKDARWKVARMLGESPNVWKQVEFFRSHRNFSSFPLGQHLHQQDRLTSFREQGSP